MAEQGDSEPAVIVERRSGGGGMGLFLLGVAVGAGLALLYAPRSGAQTRAGLRREARRLKRRARRAAERVQESAEDLVQETRTAAHDAAREAREALERRLARHGRPRDDDAEDAVV